jgi:hypothetical protein
MTTQSSSTGMPNPPVIKDGKEVYNMIMGEIEADLTLDNLPNNEEKYEGQTKEQTIERAQRYKAAFIEYNERYAKYKQEQDDAVRVYGRKAIQAVEEKSSARDDGAMSELESAISNS